MESRGGTIMLMVCYADECSPFCFPLMNETKWTQTDHQDFPLETNPLFPAARTNSCTGVDVKGVKSSYLFNLGQDKDNYASIQSFPYLAVHICPFVPVFTALFSRPLQLWFGFHHQIRISSVCSFVCDMKKAWIAISSLSVRAQCSLSPRCPLHCGDTSFVQSLSPLLAHSHNHVLAGPDFLCLVIQRIKNT